MPHIHIRSFKPVALPAKKENVAFHFMASNVAHTDEHLIATGIGDKEFFLLVKDTAESVLLKSEKISRPSPTYIVKQALNQYAALTESEILASNVNDTSEHLHLVEDASLWSIHDFGKGFPEADDVRVEVGFGSGRHLIHQAKENPDVLFIGIEIHKPSLEQALKQINILGLKNLILLDYDARLFLELIPSNIVSRIYVHFPVPWDKKPHRRVISPAFITESTRVLAPQGRLELRTDSENYFAYSWETFISLTKAKLEVNKNQDIAISSKYEDRWKKMEKNIYDITLINDEISPELKLEGSFLFKNGMDEERLTKLNTTTQKVEGGFIHFERLYTTDDGRMMFRVSMGSFERPEHLYVIIGKEKSYYFPTQPVASQVNFAVHKHLDELLHG
ncbi:MAG: tRNA (guanosine(46)-N7)-methyltransferase TrmB [Helicobacteraceae bacterium]|jgi:tRNA (guanine-N7-)-methyltransferase|nr:tRNA (guanosine(46)-N7)-methyltransferase TrmB [Helicobacteraceae bacterium]